jgi:DNA topoisomerase VI subunit B
MLKKYLQKHEYSNNISAKTSVFKKYLDKIMNTQKNISAKNMNTQKNISEKTRVLLKISNHSKITADPVFSVPMVTILYWWYLLQI